MSTRPRLAILLCALLQGGVSMAAETERTVRALVPPKVAAVGAPDDSIRLLPEVAEALGDLGLRESVRVLDWPVAPGLYRTLRLTRYDVYSEDARILRVDRNGPVEVPRSVLRFYTGAAEVDPATRALIVFDPRTSSVTAFTETPQGGFELVKASRPGESQSLVSRAARALLDPPLDFKCATSCGPLEGRGAPVSAGARLTSLHSVTIAIETDNELMLNNFADNTTAAADFFAQMFAGLNVIYERDHFVRLLQGVTLLRVSTTPDPYNNVESNMSMHMGEVFVEWSKNYTWVQRAQIMIISGMTNAGGAGLSGLNTLCGSAASIARIPGITNPLTPVGLVGHELGHAFGAVHTHCPPNLFGGGEPSDKCWAGEADRGCWAGAQSCPDPMTINGVTNVRGTIMSYCGRIACPTTNVFHPDSSAVIGGNLVSKVGVCVFDMTSPTSRLKNISTRGRVETGDNILIGGFIVGGSGPKQVVITGRGPSLASQGVPNTLANPAIRLFNGATPIEYNDDWPSSPNAPTIAASTFAPGHPQDAAIFATVTPGVPYTVHLTGIGDSTGVAIVEVFEVNATQNPLLNISTRGRVQTGDDVMIGGFIIQGDSPQQVLITARGPALAGAPFNLTGVLADPTMEVYAAGNPTPIASNDNWGTDASAAQVTSSGNAPTNPLESALMRTLAPGAYTVVVRGMNGSTGIGIVEVFRK